MKLLDWFSDLKWTVRDRLEHHCTFSLEQIGLYEDIEHREHPSAIPLVAQRYKCKCGRTHIDYTKSGIRLLQKGLSEEQVVTRWI